jgi:hypothetical protein
MTAVLMGFCSRTVGANDLPKLEIDRKVMQYRRYEKLYPNSTCKEHCDAKKGLVPYLQVCFISSRNCYQHNCVRLTHMKEEIISSHFYIYSSYCFSIVRATTAVVQTARNVNPLR